MLTFSDTDPKINPAQEEALRTDSSLTRDTMTLSIRHGEAGQEPEKREPGPALNLPGKNSG
jgi:hypothetical protein